ncbi:hypothetical protein AB1Y20_009444 [Prymnesium parvum]|uniref:DNA-directed RNA polymerase III subunit n=1 Tax=Prymnesium parvum TaxID=97485 RepID=A0AB34K0Q5_PRYPA|eukprot:CAMPEP_0113261026 /NCGR_PEP_ID=MMETSP0008_2-20120614/17187_1 /TAXON_ID=97485 /ORGANISM="Prymnesium parvum" /LENGTH=234 /DNA_ID=CAMNT_0000109627 /DNA_START=15 /DNA_END=719 /DNA_ORIENTATION=+ /assembly_acc=CAM_ASM_000153
MYGRGRGGGRGRGIPINYPDGWAAKPPPACENGALPADKLPAALQLTASDKEALTYQRQLKQHPAFIAFRVGDAQQPTDVARYSDRYRKTARGPFSKSEFFCLRAGEHYVKELDPASKTAKAATSSSGERPRKRLRKSTGGDLALEHAWSDDERGDVDVEDGTEEGEEGDESEVRKVRKTENDEPKEEGEEGGEEDDDAEDEEELYEDGDDGFGDDFEDGMDDLDDGGDDEPTY